jgi:hypothetical protein
MESPARPTVALKTLALPVEHGGWGFLAEPVVVGLAIAPSAAGACLAVATCAAFLARHPLRLWLMDRRKGARYPRTAMAAAFAAGYAALALLGLGAGVVLSDAPIWGPLVASAPVGLVAIAFDAVGRSREALPEAAGAVALGAAAAAIALAGGAPGVLAWGAWALLALRAVTAVLYVRARLRLDRGLDAGPWLVHAGHAVALASAATLAARGWAPWLAPAAFAVLLVRAGWGLSSRRRRVRPQVVGFQEIGYGLLTVLALAVGYRLGP